MAPSTDVLIMGGGIIGLAIALELWQRNITVRVITHTPAPIASWAAAGMLAPQAEGLPPGPMLDLCLGSRALYPAWTEQIAAHSGLDPGYWPCGILAPRYSSPPQPDSHWLTGPRLGQLLPPSALDPDLAGGYWYPQDGQVDNRALYRSLQVAVNLAGIEVLAARILTQPLPTPGPIDCLETDRGSFRAGHYVVAAGAWSHQLIEVPVVPRKGQMLAVSVPPGVDPPLDRVLFGEEVYIVPRRDGRIIIGATSEDVGFQPGNTAVGVATLLQRAARLCPALATYPVLEQWWGFRPATPDEGPILGSGPQANLILATGHYRNGILLAPGTARLIGDLVCQRPAPLLEHFSYRRFQPEPTGHFALHKQALVKIN